MRKRNILVERKILQLNTNGLNRREIAKELGLAESYVKNILYVNCRTYQGGKSKKRQKRMTAINERKDCSKINMVRSMSAGDETLIEFNSESERKTMESIIGRYNRITGESNDVRIHTKKCGNYRLLITATEWTPPREYIRSCVIHIRK